VRKCNSLINNYFSNAFFKIPYHLILFIIKTFFYGTLLRKHKVRDYEQWRPYFDGDQQRIKSAGAKCVNIMRSTDDPNEIHFLFDVPDLPRFLSILEAPETAGVMEQAGVLEQPKLFRLEELGA
jgi:hypothetical protein